MFHSFDFWKVLVVKSHWFICMVGLNIHPCHVPFLWFLEGSSCEVTLIHMYGGFKHSSMPCSIPLIFGSSSCEVTLICTYCGGYIHPHHSFLSFTFVLPKYLDFGFEIRVLFIAKIVSKFFNYLQIVEWNMCAKGTIIHFIKTRMSTITKQPITMNSSITFGSLCHKLVELYLCNNKLTSKLSLN
jgi:hypothetical protein